MAFVLLADRNSQATRQTAGWGSLLVVLLAAPAYGQPQSSSSNVGYIDNAIPGDQVRLRVEAAYDINRSDRAAFIYSPGFDPRIDYQDVGTYVEVAAGERFSGFAELHEHFVNPLGAPNASGLGDMTAGRGC